MPDGWGPDGRRAAIGITFDNLGEAMELATGAWPQDRPVGHHPAIRGTLPRVLDVLDEYDLRATYFAEGWSAGVYPDVLDALVAAGHEVGYHGWRHEHWADISSPEHERDLIARGLDAMRERGIELRGFRPPGGVLTASTVGLARAHGFSYLSPAAQRTGLLAEGLVALPFKWTAIDAYYAWSEFAPLRRRLGDTADVLAPTRMIEAMRRAVRETIAAGGCLTLLFHPFLLREEEWFAAMREVLEFVSDCADVWSAPCRELADWALAAPEAFASEAPELDERSWR